MAWNGMRSKALSLSVDCCSLPQGYLDRDIWTLKAMNQGIIGMAYGLAPNVGLGANIFSGSYVRGLG